jgi:ketosteroid isomerase-like protein
METKALSTAERNAELVKRGYTAFNAADMKTLSEIFHENSSWHTPGKSTLAGDRKGRQNVFAQFGRYGGETQGTFRAELKEVCANNEGRVVALHRNTGTRNGKQLNVDCCIVFDIVDGQAVSGTEYYFDLHAWDEFWS